MIQPDPFDDAAQEVLDAVSNGFELPQEKLLRMLSITIENIVRRRLGLPTRYRNEYRHQSATARHHREDLDAFAASRQPLAEVETLAPQESSPAGFISAVPLQG